VGGDLREDQIPFDPKLHKGMAIDMCVQNFSGAVLKALAAPIPSVSRVTTHGLQYQPAFRMKYA